MISLSSIHTRHSMNAPSSSSSATTISSTVLFSRKSAIVAPDSATSLIPGIYNIKKSNSRRHLGCLLSIFIRYCVNISAKTTPELTFVLWNLLLVSVLIDIFRYSRY